MEDLSVYGPLSGLIGVWEGEKGNDVAPSDDRGVENNKFRERMTFTPIKPVDNHEQHLFGFRYSTIAFRIGEADPFHEEAGYWLWDPMEKQVMKCFNVPRGMSLIAGGKVEASAKKFELKSELGSATYGICSNLFLDREFKTVRYQLKLDLSRDGFLSYEQDTVLKIKGQGKEFHHTDSNALRKIE